VTAYNLLYSIRVTDDPVQPDQLPPFYNPAHRLFVLALLDDPEKPGELRYDLSALDGVLKGNASNAAISEAWLALGAMLLEHLDHTDPMREVLIGAEAHYRKAVLEE
jgi:hypothetical protein